MADYDEVGTTGYLQFNGQYEQAYTRELRWPDVEPIYTRLWRSDPETAIVRSFLSALSAGVKLSWAPPENPNAADLKALAFAESLGKDIEGGLDGWLRQCMERVTFYGWGFWETPLCLRRKNWKPPGRDAWRSKNDDGLVGVRRLAWRDYSSFSGWQIDEVSGLATGFNQYVLTGDRGEITIPFSQGLHVTWGDNTNPEGLAMLEALYRLEAYKRNLELVMGIGFERSAGHVRVTVKENLNDTDRARIRAAARALMTGQEGNYVTDIADVFSTEVIDVPFAASGNILEAIRYYGILKLALFGMQFVALSSLSGAGSYAALDDSSSLAITLANATKDGMIAQFNDQVVARLFQHPVNASRFAGITEMPKLVGSDLAKSVDLPELAAFASAIQSVMPLSEEDIIAIRTRSGLLPEKPAAGTIQAQPQDAQDAQDTQGGQPPAEMARRFVSLPLDETMTSTVDDAVIEDTDIDGALRRYFRWVKKQ